MIIGDYPFAEVVMKAPQRARILLFFILFAAVAGFQHTTPRRRVLIGGAFAGIFDNIFDGKKANAVPSSSYKSAGPTNEVIKVCANVDSLRFTVALFPADTTCG